MTTKKHSGEKRGLPLVDVSKVGDILVDRLRDRVCSQKLRLKFLSPVTRREEGVEYDTPQKVYDQVSEFFDLMFPQPLELAGRNFIVFKDMETALSFQSEIVQWATFENVLSKDRSLSMEPYQVFWGNRFCILDSRYETDTMHEILQPRAEYKDFGVILHHLVPVFHRLLAQMFLAQAVETKEDEGILININKMSHMNPASSQTLFTYAAAVAGSGETLSGFHHCLRVAPPENTVFLGETFIRCLERYESFAEGVPVGW